jgi:hypothetical protein
VSPLRLAVIVGAAAVTALALRLLRDFPWSLAGIVGVAVGVLVLTSLKTGDRLRDAFRR